MSACEKCGGEDIYTRFHAQGCDRAQCSCSKCSYDSLHKRHTEHLHHICRGCGFDWITETADAVERTQE